LGVIQSRDATWGILLRALILILTLRLILSLTLILPLILNLWIILGSCGLRGLRQECKTRQ